MNEEWGWYMRKVRQCEVTELKERYEVIRLQKSLPDIRKMAW